MDVVLNALIYAVLLAPGLAAVVIVARKQRAALDLEVARDLEEAWARAWDTLPSKVRAEIDHAIWRKRRLGPTLRSYAVFRARQRQRRSWFAAPFVYVVAAGIISVTDSAYWFWVAYLTTAVHLAEIHRTRRAELMNWYVPTEGMVRLTPQLDDEDHVRMDLGRET